MAKGIRGQSRAESRYLTGDRYGVPRFRFVKLDGSVRLVRRLADADWDTDELLIVEPVQRIIGTYDLDEVVRAQDVSD